MTWVRDCLDAVIQRDVRDLSRIHRLDILPRLLVKTSKLDLTDTGLARALLGVEAADLRDDRTLLGQSRETFVVRELRRQASGWEHDVRFSRYRDRWPRTAGR